MSARDFLRALRECVQAMPGFIVERADAWVAERERADADFRADLEETQRLIRQMRASDGDDVGSTCLACQGDGGWVERVDEESDETCQVECSRCHGTGRDPA